MTLPNEPHPLEYPGPGDRQERRTFLRRLLIAVGYTGAGAVIGSGGTTVLQPPGIRGGPLPTSEFDWFRDAPVGVITYYEGTLNAHPNLPSGSSPKWSVIAADRVMVGTSTAPATEGGSGNFVDGEAHAGAAIVNAGGHQHDAHTSLLATGALLTGVLNGPTQHSVDGVHTHAFTEPTTHPAPLWRKSYVLKKVAP